MDSKKKEKILQMNRKNLFLELEDCKTIIDNDINNVTEENYENAKTYNDYHWRLNLNSNNFNNKSNNDFLNNEKKTDEKNENQNISNEDKINNNISFSKESQNENNNNNKLMNEEENDSKVKQIFNNDNKIEKEEDIIQNISAIENKNSPIKIDSLKKQNNLEDNYIDNKENINNNIKRKPLIHEPNILNSTKILVLKQKINNRNSKNNSNVDNIKNNEEKQRDLSHKRSSKNEDKSINYISFSNNNKIKNKIYHYLTNFEDTKNNNNFKNNYNNMRLDILRRKIINNNKFENISDSARTSRLTYVGLKRYQNISLSNLSQIKKGIDTYYMINDNINKVNNLKRKINNIANTDNTNDLNTNPKFYDILKKNKDIEDIFSSIVKPNINNKNKKHYNKILNQLNKTIEKLSKNKGNFEKIDVKGTFRRFSYTRLNEISPIKKNRKKKITLFDKVNLTKTNNNSINDKNNKLLFESKMNNMNNTINQLLKKAPEFCKEKRITFPANNFRKNKSISKIFNNSRQNSRVLLI